MIKKILYLLLIVLCGVLAKAQGPITGSRIQANLNLLPPIDTVAAPYRVGEIRTKVVAVTPTLFICISLSADKKWESIGSGISSVSGTTNRILSSGGTNPVIDIAATYVGQSSITTLGTIGTGTWQGTAIGAAYGGTGRTSNTVGFPLIGNGTSAMDTSIGLFVDKSNIRIGIGTSTPAVTVDVNANLPIMRLFATGTSSSPAYRLHGGSSGGGSLDFYQGATFRGAFGFGSGLFAFFNGYSSTYSWATTADANNYLRFYSKIGTASLTTPTAFLHLGAGTATASTAPLKFTAGTNLTTPETGAAEFDGTNYFVTSSTTRYTLAKTLTNTASLDFPSVIAGGTEVLTIAVTGAGDGDIATVGVPIASQTTGLIWRAYVSATNTVTVSVTNTTAAPVEPATATFRVSVLKY